MTSNNYYDIDAILAEEELIPCRTRFDFSHLAHLDPDLPEKQHYLPAKSRIRMPIWAVEKWAMSNYVQVSLPRHYGRKARERLEADPSEANLRKYNDCYFTSGKRVIELLESVSHNAIKYINSLPSSRRRELQNDLSKAQQTEAEAKALRQTLFTLYSGDRFSQTINWSLTSVDDDVSSYTQRLTALELGLFQQGATAVVNHQYWKVYGGRQALMTLPAPTIGSNLQRTKQNNIRATTTEAANNETERNSKRQRVT